MRPRSLATAALIGALAGGAIVLAGVSLFGLPRKEPTAPRLLDGLAELVEDAHAGMPGLFGPSRPSKVIYLNRDGAHLEPGPDDAPRASASLLLPPPAATATAAPGDRVPVRRKTSGPVTIPPFKGSASDWRKIVECLRDQYAPFDVEVTDRRPSRGGYIMATFGGTPTDAGFAKGVAGLAPFNGLPVEDAVVLVFTRSLEEKPRAVCETAAMEIAHAYGLDHEFLCKDPMTYLRGCGEKQFQDQSAYCGEQKPRPCHGGERTHNSYRRLLAVLGPRPAQANPPGQATR